MMQCSILIVLILGPSLLANAEESLHLNNTGAALTEIKHNGTSSNISEKRLDNSSSTDINSTTPSLIGSLTGVYTPISIPSTEKNQILSINVTKIKKLSVKFPNSSMENGQALDRSEKTNTVITEGGTNVAMLDSSGTNFRGTHEDSQKTVVAEGGVLESAGKNILSSSAIAPARSDIDPHLAIVEGISSMNEGKIIARKGVSPENNTLEYNEEHKIGEIVKNTSDINGLSSPIRKPKPAMTDDEDESIGDYIRKMDYIIPIVCTVFSVPLLIVLAIYLYKRGADLWERRHYNRMDFLIEGMYNE